MKDKTKQAREKLATSIIMYVTEGLADPKDEETKQTIRDVADMLEKAISQTYKELLEEVRKALKKGNWSDIFEVLQSLKQK